MIWRGRGIGQVMCHETESYDTYWPANGWDGGQSLMQTTARALRPEVHCIATEVVCDARVLGV